MVSVDLSDIGEFSTFDPISKTITFNLEDTDVQLGSYSAEIKLYDERDESYYTLFIEVIEQSNTAPRFTEWETLMPVMITQGDEDEVVFKMPDTIDLESDEVSISIDMDDIDHFALWNPEDEVVTLLPYEQV